MKRFPFRPVVAGALIGAALFFAPFFLLRAVLFVLLIGLLFRLFGRGRWYGRRMHHYNTYLPASHTIHLRKRDVQDISID